MIIFQLKLSENVIDRLLLLCTCLMIAFACGCMVVTCIWFGSNCIIVLHTYFFELKFEFYPLFYCQRQEIEVAGNLPTRCYETNPGWMLLTY
jgi:hypothetical protein